MRRLRDRFLALLRVRPPRCAPAAACVIPDTVIRCRTFRTGSSSDGTYPARSCFSGRRGKVLGGSICPSVACSTPSTFSILSPGASEVSSSSWEAKLSESCGSSNGTSSLMRLRCTDTNPKRRPSASACSRWELAFSGGVDSALIPPRRDSIVTANERGTFDGNRRFGEC